MRPSARKLVIIILSFPVPLPSLLSQWKHYKTLSAHRLDETICCLQAWLICCSLFYYLWLEAGGCFSTDKFNIKCLWPNWYCANKQLVSFILFQNRCLLKKILTTESSTAFVHMGCYNQHKMKDVKDPLSRLKRVFNVEDWGLSSAWSQRLKTFANF